MEVSYENIKGKKIWIWGCGNILNRYLHSLSAELKIQGIFDIDSEKHGTIVDWNGKKLVCNSPQLNDDIEAIIIAIENVEAANALETYLTNTGIQWCHIIDAVDGYFLDVYNEKNSEKPYKANNYVKYIDCAVPIDTCNLQCEYCYLGHNNITLHHRKPRLHSPKYIRKALSRERMGGSIFINFCGIGETLLCDELPEIVNELIQEGHIVQIVTNATIKKAVDAFINSEIDLSYVMFKCSLHYLELKKRGLLDIFASNVLKLRDAGASVTIEIAPGDELVPYIDEVKEYCRSTFGILPHVTVLRDERKKDFCVLSKYPLQEYRKIWGVFNSEMFFFKLEHLEPQRYHDCMAGLWSAHLNLASGELTKCVYNPRIGNLYEDLSEEIPFEKVGDKCCLPYCYNCHSYLTFGLIPTLETPTYFNMRNHETNDGKQWISETMRKIFSQKLYENNVWGDCPKTVSPESNK